MAMLAEVKRREKWCLNPRGNAWSKDENKFGQRLMEKMGWKSGQGLGVNSQGKTDIIKTRAKNDSKGLGFKDNGEEWLKTTGEFDVLLEELSSSKEGSGEGSQTDTPVSLEDRSKKSKARVHYHKYTRGKDLSRYSKKDLASIIGPDVVELKDRQESETDYTQNQENKGNMEEYFRHKSKLKKNNPEGNNISNEVYNGGKETMTKSKDKSRSLEESNDNSLTYAESEVVMPPIKKKKRKKTDSEGNQEDNSNEHNVNCEVELDQTYLENVVSNNKKNRKVSGDIQHNANEIEESNSNVLDSESSKKVKKEKKIHAETGDGENTKESSDLCQSDVKISKKKKRKHENDVENSTYLENEKCGSDSNIEETVPKKKKRKEILVGNQSTDEPVNNKTKILCDELLSKKGKKNSKQEIREYQEDNECTNNNLLVIEKALVDDKIISNKKIKKIKEKNNENQEDYECKNNNYVDAVEASVNDEVIPKKKKKRSKEEKEHQEDVDGSINHNSLVADVTLMNTEIEFKKKKKKSKEKNSEPQEKPEEERTVKKKKKKAKQCNEEDMQETTPESKQVNSISVDEIFSSSHVKKKKKSKKDQ